MKKPLSLNALTLSLGVAMSAYAESDYRYHVTLPEAVVYGEHNLPISKGHTTTAKEIANTPATDGNISDHLKTNPHVRYKNSDDSSMQQGEIKPADISINGAEASQTSYFVDNVNINNDLGLGADIFDGTMATVPQANNAQAYFFDANLLSSVVVYDSDVSASLGGFGGGAVVAKTKHYTGDDNVQLTYRGTRSEWASLQVDADSRDAFYNAMPNGSSADYQPDYQKHAFSISGEHGLGDKLGMTYGISRRLADISQNRIIDSDGNTAKQDHTRRSDNILLNLAYTPNDQHRLEWSTRYSNYREKKFYAGNLDSNVKDYHQAIGGTLAWVMQGDGGVLTTTVAYDQFDDKRRADSTYMQQIITLTGDEYSLGGMGDSDLRQTNTHLSAEYAPDPFVFKNMEHSVSLGGIYQATDYAFERKQDAISEILMDFGAGLSVIDSHTAKQGQVNASYQSVSLYAEDLIKVGDVEIRPGLRVERDDYLSNTNISPRFVARYRPFTDAWASLGLNRYYGRSFASMKLAEGIMLLDGNSTFRYQDVGNFKTPHSDELSVGWKQLWHNIDIHAKYIHRSNKNRIVLHEDSSTGDVHYKTGKDYRSDIYTLELSNHQPWQWQDSSWQAGLALDYLDSSGVDIGRGYDDTEMVIFDGQTTTYGDMRAKTNNQQEEWTLRLSLDAQLPRYDITWSNRLYIKAPISGIENYDTVGSTPLYRSYDYGTHTQWDSSVRWQPKAFGGKAHIKFDVLNLLNQTRRGISSTGEDYGFYATGREFWLEFGYQF